MGRPTKQGIDYFSIDCNFDEKIEMYLIEVGASGLGILITLWQMIYSNEGYFVSDNEDLRLIIKKRIDADINDINVSINTAIKRSIFDSELHEKHQILTSRAIQKRYFDAAKRKKEITIIDEFMLVDPESYINPDKCNINRVNVSKNATKEKEEEKEEEKVKEEEDSNTCPTSESQKLDLEPDSPHSARKTVPYQEILNRFHNICPDLRQVRVLSDARKRAIKARWGKEITSLDSWEKYFRLVHGSDFLCGRVAPGKDRDTPWQADFDWLLKPANVIKIVEGKYRD